MIEDSESEREKAAYGNRETQLTPTQSVGINVTMTTPPAGDRAIRQQNMFSLSCWVVEVDEEAAVPDSAPSATLSP